MSPDITRIFPCLCWCWTTAWRNGRWEILWGLILIALFQMTGCSLCYRPGRSLILQSKARWMPFLYGLDQTAAYERFLNLVRILIPKNNSITLLEFKIRASFNNCSRAILSCLATGQQNISQLGKQLKTSWCSYIQARIRHNSIPWI